MICVTRKFYLEIHSIVALHNQVKKAYIFDTSMVSNVKAKKLNNKLRGASAGIQDFIGVTIKHLKQRVIPSLVDDTPDIAVIQGGCNNLGYKNKEALSTDDIVNEIGKLCRSHGVKDIFISSLICRKNNLQKNKNFIGKYSFLFEQFLMK